MPLVPGYAYDLFVSYAHRDNLLPEGTKAQYGWVTALAHNLNVGPSVLDKQVHIDHQLGPGDAFNDDLLRAVSNSAVLLLALSQNYIGSKWCGKELDHFVSTHSDDPRKPRNVVVVELAPFEDLVDVPPAIEQLRRELIQAKFWSRPRDADVNLVAGYPSPDESGLAAMYFREISQLTQAIDRRLRGLRALGLRSQAAGPGTAVAPVASASARQVGPAVLLAAVTKDLEPQRRELARALEAERILVLPESDYDAHAIDDLEHALRSDLNGSVLFVQLLSPAPGRVPRGGSLPLPQLQFARAIETRLPILQWAQRMPYPGEIHDPGHGALLATRYLLTLNPESFKAEVLERYRALIAPPPKVGVSSPTIAPKRKAVFLDDALAQPDQRDWIRHVLRDECEIRSPPKGTALDDVGFPVRELLRPCRGGLTLYSDRRDRATAAQRLYWCLNQIVEHSLSLSRWGVHLALSVSDVDFTAEFGIESPDLVPMTGMTAQGEASLVNFVRAL